MRLIDFNGLAGFMTYSFTKNGFDLVARTGTLDFGNVSIDKNRHLVGDKWEYSFGDSESDWIFPDEPVEVVAGLPPCSGWSCWTSASARGRDAKAHDHTWALMRYAGLVGPKMVVFESVQQAFNQGHDLMRDYHALLEQLSGKRYTLHHVLMNNLLVGGFSFRPRYFFVAVEEGIPFGVDVAWPSDEHGLPTMNEVIRDLEDAEWTWDRQPYRSLSSRWVRHLKSPTFEFDGHIGKENNNSANIKEIFDNLPGGEDDWEPRKDMSHMLAHIYSTKGELPPRFKHKQQELVDREFSMGFSLPARWHGTTWANVLTGAALDIVVHPNKPRLLTHREAARIQGVPDDWRIAPARHYSALADTWGKAVSAQAGAWMATWARESLEGRPGGFIPEQVGDREYVHETDDKFTRKRVADRYYQDPDRQLLATL